MSEVEVARPQKATPYYQDELATLYLGNAAEISLNCEVDLIVTDPPYGVAYVSGRRQESFLPIEGDHDLEIGEVVLGKWLPHLRLQRHLYVFGPFERSLARLPVSAITELVWDKEIIGMGDLSLPWGTSHEQIYFGVHIPFQSQRKRGDGNGVARMRKRTVLRCQRVNGRSVTSHPTEKPVALLRDLIESSSLIGETVFDPFAGSGSTLVAASLEGRRSVGIEIEADYAEIAAKRLASLRTKMQEWYLA